MSGRGARNGADGGIQDTAQHVLDRACTHESSNVQGVQECGWEGRDAHCDARVCEARSHTRLCVPFEMRDVYLGEGDGGDAWISKVCADGEGDGC
jgi:hypothetical protein